jgi:hypothetical protein
MSREYRFILRPLGLRSFVKRGNAKDFQVILEEAVGNFALYLPQ